MREQQLQVQTGRKEKIICIILTLVLAIAVCVAFFRAFIYERPFTPPDYESNAIIGTPIPPEDMGYGVVSAPNGFSVGLCGVMYQQDDGSLMIYLTNPETNLVKFKCEIKNELGEVLYHSGVLCPGEYVQYLQPDTKLPNEAIPITVYIYGYEETTWYSVGTIELTNVLQAW